MKSLFNELQLLPILVRMWIVGWRIHSTERQLQAAQPKSQKILKNLKRITAFH